MSPFRRVTDTFAVAAQIEVADLARAASDGFTLIINNRPDDESPDQPVNAAMAAAARAAGLDYVWAPVVGAPTRAQAEAVREAMAATAGKTLAFCRSGTRSINTWALGQAMSGEQSVEALTSLAAKAGYDLSWLSGVGR